MNFDLTPLFFFFYPQTIFKLKFFTLDENSPKPSFIREVLEKCRRFCYHQRIVETVPQDFEHLVPNEPSIRFKYRQDEDEDDQGI